MIFSKIICQRAKLLRIKLQFLFQQDLLELINRGDFKEHAACFLKECNLTEMHYYQITDVKTDFFWGKSVFAFYISDIQSAMKWKESLLVKFENFFKIDVSESTKCLTFDEYSFGNECNNSDIILSTYLWQSSVDDETRKRNMWQHFEMEKEQDSYTSVHFSVPFSEDCSDFQFMFEGFLKDRTGISKIYISAWLHKMRKHSASFLDTTTRKLAFGKAYIFQS